MKTAKEFRKQVYDLVRYMMDEDDVDTVESYTDTIMETCRLYHEEKLKELTDEVIQDESHMLAYGDWDSGYEAGTENGMEKAREWYLNNNT